MIDADVNYQNSKDKSTVLQAVVQAVDVMRVLLKRDAKADIKDKDGREAATFWKGVFDVEQTSFEMVCALFVQILSTHSNPQPPLLHVIYLGQIEKVREFAEQGTFMNECSKIDKATNLTPIGLACEIGNPDIIQLLFCSGAKVNTDVDGVDGPQYIAAQIGNTPIIQMLKAFGTNFQALLHYATACVELNCLLFILTTSPHVDATMVEYSETVLHIAARRG
ncbi:hypothetical protein HDU84_008013 [Entophlyctis sp. JEL0112]|nr:hypothetical protein HDU84_008013 [Entophlyctis sp. JEL0112]